MSSIATSLFINGVVRGVVAMRTRGLTSLPSLFKLGELSRWVAGDSRHPATVTIDIDEGPSLDVVLPLPLDRESRVGILDMDRFGIAIASQPCGQVVDSIEKPRITGFGREKNQ